MWYISVILWTSDARNYVIKLQVLQTMCFRIATLIQVVNSQGCMVFFSSEHRLNGNLWGGTPNLITWKADGAVWSYPLFQTTTAEAL